jgi:hypothetical protein
MTTLSAAERRRVRFAARCHPDILDHVSKLADIESLNKAQLFRLASRLKIDIEAVKAGTLLENSKRDAEEDQDRRRYSLKNPAFTGTIEEDLTLVMFGRSVTRTLRVTYAFTPSWPYYDLKKNCETKGSAQCVSYYEFIIKRPVTLLHLPPSKIRYIHDRENRVNCIDIFNREVLGDDMDTAMWDRIEEKCLRENARRKKSARP